MDRGTYSATSGGLLQFRKLDLNANNLANVNTPGFKRQMLIATAQDFESTFAKEMEGKDPYAKGDHERTPGVVHVESVTDFSVGSIRTTGNPLDVALRNPNDFFVVNTPDGPEYTRAGNFTLNAEGNLISPDGFEVQGDSGPLTVDGASASIGPGGTVRAGGVDAGRLQVVHFDDPKGLERVGATRFKLGTGQSQPQTVEPDVVPNSLEMSNVSTITGIIDLIATNRAFEAYTKSSQTIDQLNQTAITQIGKQR